MNKKIYQYFAMTLFTIVAITAPIAAYSEVDTDFMTAMDDLNKSLTSNVALSDAKAAASDAKEMQKMFDEVEAFFLKKADAADGVKWAQESRDLAASIAKSVTANDFDSASQTAVTLSKTCKACHKIYKKKN
jgi:DNA-binding GntR family transcriptional regulator